MNNEPNFISHDEVKNFITLQDEELILAKRKHWIIMIAPIINSVLIWIVVMTALYVGTLLYFSIPVLFLTISLLVITVSISRIVKLIIEWYCHLYIITDRRIMEIRHVPFSSYHVNDLLLDQMRVAEIDVEVGSIYNELVGKGDVIIQVDQLAREHHFRLSDVGEPRKTAMFLTQVFGQRMQNLQSSTLYRYQPKFVL